MPGLYGLIYGIPDTPLTAIHVLYCKLICAFTLGFDTAVEPAEDGISLPSPMRVKQSIVLVSLTGLLFPTNITDGASLLPFLFLHSLQATYTYIIFPRLFSFLNYISAVMGSSCNSRLPIVPSVCAQLSTSLSKSALELRKCDCPLF
jgi:hypothetical protein